MIRLKRIKEKRRKQKLLNYWTIMDKGIHQMLKIQIQLMNMLKEKFQKIKMDP